jgi:hypothetical protein
MKGRDGSSYHMVLDSGNHVPKYSHCMFSIVPIGEWTPVVGSNRPFGGRKGRLIMYLLLTTMNNHSLT